jgi:single-strand DNA-binding protein
MNVTVVGNLGNDPELKFVKTAKGDMQVVSFSLAYTPRERKGNEYVEGETMWFRVSQWGDKAEALVDALRKGDSVIVQGIQKQSPPFKTRDGSEKTALEINATTIGLVVKAKASKKVEMPEW